MESRWYNLRANITIILVIVIFIINGGAQFLLYSNQDTLATIFFGDPTKTAPIRIVIAISLLTSAATMVIWGYFGDKSSKKNVLIISSIIWIAACFYIYFMPNISYNQLLLGQIFFGLGFGAVWPICYSLLGDIVKPESRGKVFSIVNMTIGAGLVIGLFLGSWFPDASNWQVPFLIIAIIGLALVIIFFIFGIDLQRGGAEHELQQVLEKGAIYTYDISREHLRALWRKRSNINMFLQGIPGMIPWAVLLIAMPAYFQFLGFNEVSASFIVVLSQVTNVFGALWAGWYGDRLAARSQRSRVLMVAYTILIPIPFFIAAFLMPYPVVPPNSGLDMFFGQPLFLIGFLLLNIGSFFAAAAGVNWYAVVEEFNEPEVRSTIISFHALTDRVGNAIGPFIAAGFSVLFLNLFGAQWQDPGAIAVACLFWIPCSYFWFRSRKSIEQDVQAMKALLKKRAEEMGQKLG
jgi:MFS family permease